MAPVSNMFFVSHGLKLLFWTLFAGIILASCANIGSLGGGPVDKTPPKITQVTPENGSVNFKSNTIVLEFDELIKLNNPEQIVITPQPPKRPQFDGNGDRVKVTFQDSLQPNTTYVISFLDLIGDNNENNRLKGFRYVFSTGPQVDSASLRGVVIQASTGKPWKEATVGLFADTLGDTMLLGRAALYLTKSDSSGRFLFENLSEKPFRILAFTDKDQNYQAGTGEEISLPTNKTFQPSKAGTLTDTLKLVKAFPRQLKLTEIRAVSPGRIRLKFNKPLDSAAISLQNGPWIQAEMNLDSGFVLHQDLVSDSLNIRLIAGSGALRLDTLRIGNKQADGKLPRPVWAKINEPLPGDSLVLKLSRSITQLDTARIALFADSIALKFNSIRYSAQCLTLGIPNKLKGKLEVRIKDSLAMDDLKQYSEKALFSFNLPAIDDLGQLKLINLEAKPKNPLILVLLNEKEQPIRTLLYQGGGMADFNNLRPDSYRLKIIEDLNRNGKADEGDYFQLLAPEPSRTATELIKMRANWELEQDVKLLGF